MEVEPQTSAADLIAVERSHTDESLNGQVIELSLNQEEEEEEDVKRIRTEDDNQEEKILCSFKLTDTDTMLQKLAQVKSASAATGAVSYIHSLIRLCEIEGNQLAITSTTYEFVNPNHKVVFYDVKCRARFEDDIIDRICRQWPEKSKMKDVAPICPLRRGICVGLLDGKHLILAAGNAKFFYGEEDEIVSTLTRANDKGTILLTEKANGEYTLLSSTKTPPQGDESEPIRWLIVGSKNVRLCLPYVEGDPNATKRAFDQIVFAFSNNNTNKEEGHRYSYLKDMLDLWLKGLEGESGKRFLAELDSGVTLVGEQVGVHAHIFTGYAKPHIRLFASLAHSRLHHELACNIPAVDARLFSHKPKDHASGALAAPLPREDPITLVKFEAYALPAQKSQLMAGLDRIASGPMEIYGEGVVAYVYDGNDSCINLFKFKCQEYAFDRRLRTVLSRPASELHKSGLSPLRLRDEVGRVEAELRKAATTQFSRMNRERAENRIASVPAMLAFLDRHQGTFYCADFSEHFVDFLRAVDAKRTEYDALAKRTFLQAYDAMESIFTTFLNKFEQIFVPVRGVEELAMEIFNVYKERGGFEKYQSIGIASPPGGGKTAVLRALEGIFQQHNIPCKLCDRDAYVIADPGARGDVIHKLWTDDIHYSAKNEGKVCLVGNTFSGGFADKLENQTKTKILLFAWKEVTVLPTKNRMGLAKKEQRDGLCAKEDLEKCRAASFYLESLRRLFARRETHADGSTLTMGLGTRIVLDKFFSSYPEEKMLDRRLKQGSAALVSYVPQTSFNYREASELTEAVIRLRGDVANPPVDKAALTKEAELEGKVHRTNYFKCSIEYVRQSVSVVSSTNSLVSRIRFVGLMPEHTCAKQMLALADDDLLRTDCHVTLVYQPTEGEIRSMTKSLLKVEQVKSKLLGKVTVRKKNKDGKEHKLQFLMVGRTGSQVVDELLPKQAHVTLGSSNPDYLPHSTSGKVLLELMERNLLDNESITTESNGPIQLKDGSTAVIEPLKGGTLEFVGAPMFYCVSKS